MLGKNKNNKPCVLIITLICGGGHLQAANALRKKIVKADPAMSVIQVDLFNDWMGKLIGRFLTNIWNVPLQKGHNFISLCYSYFGIPIADVIFFIPLFIQAFRTFQKYSFLRIIDTQCVGTTAITLALYLSNKLKKKNLKVEKILTEIPTKRAIHFFHPLRLLPNRLKKLIELNVVEPLPLEQNFWKKNTGLNDDQIKIITPPLREAFFQLSNLPITREEYKIKMSFSSEEEKDKVVKIAKIESKIIFEDPRNITVDCSENCDLTTIMLGSQPHTKTIHKYLEKFSELIRHSPSKEYLLFVLGNSSISGWKQLLNFWEDLEDLPKNFHPILLSMQEHETVAHLLKISNRTITRSGGLTSMELFKIQQKNALIHTDIIRNHQPVLRKMPPWEIGNAEVLIERIGAKIIHPDFLNSLE
jgi:hypothetical protein